MVARLREAVEGLEAPHCPACRLEMKWFRSELVRDEPRSLIVHQFICPSCEGVRNQQTEFPLVRIPPDKLSAPRCHAFAA